MPTSPQSIFLSYTINAGLFWQNNQVGDGCQFDYLLIDEGVLIGL
jgi:hypothetical protein